VLLFRGRGLASTLIRWQTRSPYSHAALRLPDGRIIESWQTAGVRIQTLADWQGIDIFAVRGMGPSHWYVALNYATAQIGFSYDWLSVARFVTRRRTGADHRWFCSELVFASLAYAGVRLLERIDPAAVSPGHLALSPLLVQLE
jgi:uncharacterized protein YycO